MFVEEAHEVLYNKKTDAKVLAVRDDMAAKDILINVGGGRILMFEFLHNGVVYNVTRFVDGINVERLTGVNDDIYQGKSCSV